MVRSSDHWSNHQRGRGKINQIPVLTIREIYICPDVFLTSCSEVCLWWDDLSISFMEKEKTRRPLGGSMSLPPSFHFILLFWRFASRVDRQREGFQKAAADLIYISPPTWSGQEPRHREGRALLGLIDVPNKEQEARQGRDLLQHKQIQSEQQLAGEEHFKLD